jgi:hypothetical protein
MPIPINPDLSLSTPTLSIPNPFNSNPVNSDPRYYYEHVEKTLLSFGIFISFDVSRFLGMNILLFQVSLFLPIYLSTYLPVSFSLSLYLALALTLNSLSSVTGWGACGSWLEMPAQRSSTQKPTGCRWTASAKTLQSCMRID